MDGWSCHLSHNAGIWRLSVLVYATLRCVGIADRACFDLNAHAQAGFVRSLSIYPVSSSRHPRFKHNLQVSTDWENNLLLVHTFNPWSRPPTKIIIPARLYLEVTPDFKVRKCDNILSLAIKQAAKVDLAFRETLEQPIEMDVLRLKKDPLLSPTVWDSQIWHACDNLWIKLLVRWKTLLR